MGGRKPRSNWIGIATLLALALSPCFRGVAAWNHSQIEWRTIETANFSVHYHAEVERSAMEVARIAEEIHHPITTLYGYIPGRVHINVTDRAGFPEGAAYYYLNRIDISSDGAEFYLRGSAEWLRNVVTHEFTHMVSLQAAMKMPRRIPAIYLQGFNFEREKRPDVITGYPNFVGSLPLPGETVPNWFAEGMAQFQAEGARHDIWDSHRDMVLRSAVAGDRLLTIDRMGVFGKNALEAELLYNQGFSLVRHIAEIYGEEILAALVAEHARWYRTGFDGACRKIIGVSQDELYAGWKQRLRERYEAVAASVATDAREGEWLAGEGFINMFPLPDRGGGLIYVSNRGRDYSGVDLVRRDACAMISVLAGDVCSGADRVRGGSMLCYARKTGDNPHGYEFKDIFILERPDGKERRLTRGLKATDPAFSPSGERIVAVATEDGFERLVLIDVGDGSVSRLTPPRTGRVYYTPAWGAGGILVSVFDGTSRGIALVDPATGAETMLLDSAADERDARWTADGEGFLYASDRSGIFNIYYCYYRDPASAEDRRITNVIGGAFQPRESDGDLIFAAYTAEGYEIRRLAGWRGMAMQIDKDADDTGLMERRRRFTGSTAAGGKADGGALEAVERSRFAVSYTPVFLFPRLLLYDGRFRAGLALDTRDYLDRQTVHAAGSVGSNGEFDVYLGFEIRQFKPTFNFDLLRMRKYYEYTDPGAGKVKVRYDLWDAFFTCRFEFEPQTAFRRRDISLRYNHGEYGLNVNAWKVFDYEIGWTYYLADELSLLFDYRSLRREVEAGINPRRGRTLHLEATLAFNRLQSGEFEYSFRPVYNRNNFARLAAAYEEHFPLPLWRHALTVSARAGWIDRRDIDDFFYLYLGGRDGLRGYSYYSIGGAKNAMARVTYRFPVWAGIERQLPVIYMKSLYGALFAGAGQAWDEQGFDTRGILKDVGYELRLSGFSFFSYPLAATFMGAYGLDLLEYRDPFFRAVLFEEGREWRYYGSVLFSF